MSASCGGGGFLEEICILSGNLAVQVIFGLYMVFLNGVFEAGVSPLFFVVSANLVTAAFLLPFAGVFEMKKWPSKLTVALLSKFCLLSFGGTLFQALTLVGIEKSSPAVASAMPNLTPGFVFIIAACNRFEKFDMSCKYSRAKVMGTLVCLSGAITMCFLQTRSSDQAFRVPDNTNRLIFLTLEKPTTVLSSEAKAINNIDWTLGCFSILAGIFILSCTTVLQAVTMVNFPAPLSTVVVTSVMSSLLAALLQLTTEGEIGAGSSHLGTTNIAAIAVLGGVVCGTCIAFQTWCITRKGPVLVSIFSPVQTVTSVVVSALFLGQIIRFASIAGIALMFAGLYIVLWAKKSEGFCVVDVIGADHPKLSLEDLEKPLLS